jgi:flagellar hook-associated protein 1 FlgK
LPSAFFGLDIANTALSAAQVLMDVAGQNIANDATPGYSQQVANLVATPPYAQPDMGGLYTPQLGTGVEAQSVNRVRASYLDGLFRTTQSDESNYSTRSNYLQALQSVLNEPGSNGLTSTMNRFFSDYQTLSQNPQSSAARTVVQQDGEAIAAQIQQIYQGLQNVGQQAQNQATLDVQTVNSDLQQLANLNTTIAQAQAIGQQPNDLLDQRDNLLDSLSKLININVSTQTNTVGSYVTSQVTVTTPASGGAVTLVDGGQYGSATLTPASSGPQFTLSATDAVTGTSSAVAPTGGSIGAAYQLVNQDLNPTPSSGTSLMSEFNAAALNLVNGINNVQMQGVYPVYASGSTTPSSWSNGQAFFVTSSNTTGTLTASDIPGLEVNPAIQNDVNQITTTTQPNPALGDNSNAVAMADFGQSQNGPVQTYASFVSDMGASVDLSQNLQSTSDSLLSQITSQREQTAGVSINEQMTNLIQAQSMYTAAAKVAEAMDSSLQSLLSAIQP